MSYDYSIVPHTMRAQSAEWKAPEPCGISSTGGPALPLDKTLDVRVGEAKRTPTAKGVPRQVSADRTLDAGIFSVP